MVAKKIGRPAIEDPRGTMLRVRLNAEELKKLDMCCEHYNLSRSDVVRKGIEEQVKSIKK